MVASGQAQGDAESARFDDLADCAFVRERAVVVEDAQAQRPVDGERIVGDSEGELEQRGGTGRHLEFEGVEAGGEIEAPATWRDADAVRDDLDGPRRQRREFGLARGVRLDDAQRLARVRSHQHPDAAAGRQRADEAGGLLYGIARLAFGTSNTSANGVPLPLTGIGMTGCNLLVDSQFSAAVAGPGAQGNFALPIPGQPGFVPGVRVLPQSFSLDPAANAFGLPRRQAATSGSAIDRRGPVRGWR
ncbi:MAG: hypothetical protein INH34_06575 [Phycisphaerales bacterium]|nr:hypothetical protein [Phycisphaerales bacterium]